jgi:hypothetical protein
LRQLRDAVPKSTAKSCVTDQVPGIVSQKVATFVPR